MRGVCVNAGVFGICGVCVSGRCTGCARCAHAGGTRDVRGVRAGCTRGADGAFRAHSGDGQSARSVRAGGAGCGQSSGCAEDTEPSAAGSGDAPIPRLPLGSRCAGGGTGLRAEHAARAVRTGAVRAGGG